MAAAITSALNQDYPNLEVLVIDNASTDDTAEIASRFPTVKYFRFDDFVSMPANFNRALDLSDGEYIRLLCADDTLRSDCMRLTIAALDSNKSLTMCASSEMIKFTDGTKAYLRASSLLGLSAGDTARAKLLRKGNLIGGPSGVTVPGATYKFVRFDETLPCSFDLDAWIRILRMGDIDVLPDALYQSTIHPDQGTNICRCGGFQEDWEAILRTSRRCFGEPGNLLYVYLIIKNMLRNWRQYAG